MKFFKRILELVITNFTIRYNEFKNKSLSRISEITNIISNNEFQKIVILSCGICYNKS